MASGFLLSKLSFSNNRKLGFQGGTSDKEPTCQWRRLKRCAFNPWVGKIPWRRAWKPTPVFLPGESQGQRSLASYIQSMGLQRIRHKWATELTQDGNRRQHNISIPFIYALGNQKIHVTHFIAIFTLLQWNQTHNVSKICLYQIPSLRYLQCFLNRKLHWLETDWFNLYKSFNCIHNEANFNQMVSGWC